MPIPSDWHNPITASAGQLQSNVDAVQLLPSRPDLVSARLDVQRVLLQSGLIRWTPIRVTPDGVVVDGHHMVRAAAEMGKLIEVQVIGFYEIPVGELILDLPVR